jgi:hypothetical protein
MPRSALAPVAALDDELAPIVTRLRRDLRTAAAALQLEEARYLVDLYYQLQTFRIGAGNMIRPPSGEPNQLLRYLFDSLAILERLIPRAMDIYTDGLIVGRWAKAQYGVGPVLAAGLVAHIDCARAPTAGAVWRFAGLDPTCVWKKGAKRPWNARLKVLCWKLGQSFWKFHARPGCVYGALAAARKATESARNDAGEFAAVAAATLADRKITSPETRAAYTAGRLPAGRLQRRAERYAAKLFLAHYWQVGRESLGLPVPRPYVLTHGDAHTHFLAPPGWPLEEVRRRPRRARRG